MILEAIDLKKNYLQGATPLEILKGVSLSIEKPLTVSIMGRSGCGKTTLISLLAGLDSPTSGEINVLGQSVVAMKAGELNRFRAKNIGIIFQQFHLLPHLTAFENVRLPLDLNQVENADQKAREVLAKVGLAARADHFPEQMSRGEQQRVAIARVLVMKPAVVLADEPTGSLDVRTGKDVIELLFKLASEEGIALVLVTHDPAVAARCSRHLYMEAGHLSDQPPVVA